MQAAQITGYGNNDVVNLNQIHKPKPAATQVQVKVHAASVNPVDWKVREGYLKDMMPLTFPATIGMDFAGIVTEVGGSVADFKVGDAVYGMSNYLTGETGSFAEYLVVDKQHLNHKPKNLNSVEAAAVPIVAISAIQALYEILQLQKSQKILIHGGNGGIGMFAIQLAKHLGAYVATTVSRDGMALARQLGADEVLDYRQTDFAAKLNNYDAVFDTVGGDTYRNSFAVLKKGGSIVSMVEPPNEQLMQQYQVKAYIEFTDVSPERLALLTRLLENQVLKVHVAKVFSLDTIKAALDYQQHGRPKGKVAVKI